MDKPIYYLSYSAAVILAVVVITLEVSHFNMATTALPLLFTALISACISSLIIYKKYKNQFDVDNLYKLVASSLLFNFVIFFACISYFHRRYASFNCMTASYNVVAYQKRYVSAAGLQNKAKIKPNQWVITINKNNKDFTFVLNKDISNKIETNVVELEFCKGVFNIEYLQH